MNRCGIIGQCMFKVLVHLYTAHFKKSATDTSDQRLRSIDFGALKPTITEMPRMLVGRQRKLTYGLLSAFWHNMFDKSWLEFLQSSRNEVTVLWEKKPEEKVAEV